MTRPLVVTDCDEVLLHMVRHFRDWLARVHQIDFRMAGSNFARSMFRTGASEPMTEAEMWQLLGQFFDTEMPQQTLIAGAGEAIRELQRDADLVVLTNLGDDRADARTRQLQALGIHAKVYTNQGPKGGALKAIVQDHAASRIVFIDDIAVHHQSAAEQIPQVRRLHFCGEPALAPHIPCAHLAGHAHARIDSWSEALPWVQQQLHGEPNA